MKSVKLSLCLLPVTALVAAAGVSVNAEAAQAVSVTGGRPSSSITINGLSSLSFQGSGGLGKANVFLNFRTIDGISATGMFTSLSPSLSNLIGTNDSSAGFAIRDLTFTAPGVGGSPFYTNSGMTSFINFGTRTWGGFTGNLSFDLSPATYTVLASRGRPSVVSSNPEFTGILKFGSRSLPATGTLTSSRSGDTSSYTLTLEVEVPEPVTILGTGLALGLGVLFKHQQSKKQLVRG
ncbi:MAG: PEP-CTERM sorting domain-containing protein [Geminocystis sp.]|nr:PEP-CTERM sorting domain-containing protein [Geminocystis sp.]MDW8115110.1 PEP-CTERM sorting domain-containing protein [Geminocystis sp.]